MGNGALNEGMDLINRAIADNSQVEKPYRTTGQIFVDGNGDIDHIFVDGIFVDFDIRTYTDPAYLRTEKEETLLDNGMEKDENGDWYYPDFISSNQKRM